MTPDPRDSLSLLLAAILAMGSVVIYLFHRFLAAMDRRLEDANKQHGRDIDALRAESDARFEAMRDDRNFLRDQLTLRQDAQTQIILTVKEGITGLKVLLERLDDARRGR